MATSATFVLVALCLLALFSATGAYKLPQSGTATVTHYLLGDAVGACDCQTGVDQFPVAAINQNAFGPSSGSGPGCGRCFELKIYASIDNTPDYTIPSSEIPVVVLKVVDLCPARDPNLEWCAQTDTKPNPHGAWVHFDISQTTIPANFFPQPNGYDMGTWIANYTEVSCSQWTGWGQDNTSGLAYPGAGCCPANPTVDKNLCPFSNGGGNLTGVGDVSKAAHMVGTDGSWRGVLFALVVAAIATGWMTKRL